MLICYFCDNEIEDDEHTLEITDGFLSKVVDCCFACYEKYTAGLS